MTSPLNKGTPAAPTLSLVLITHRRERLFRQALQTLVEQDAPKDRYEVIVVDNDAEPNAEVRQASEEAGQQVRVRYIHETKLGVSNARHPFAWHALKLAA